MSLFLLELSFTASSVTRTAQNVLRDEELKIKQCASIEKYFKEKMLKQKRIDQYFSVTRKLTKNKVQQNIELPSNTQNRKKRKSIKQVSSSKNNIKLKAASKRINKHSEANSSYYDDQCVDDILINEECVGIRNNVERYALSSRIKEAIPECTIIDTNIKEYFFDDDEDIEIISQSDSTFINEESFASVRNNVGKNVSSSQISEATPECTIIHENINKVELLYSQHMDNSLPYRNTIFESNKLMHKDKDHGVPFINAPQNSNVADTSSNNSISLPDIENSPVIKSNTYTPRKLKFSGVSPRKLTKCDSGVVDTIPSSSSNINPSDKEQSPIIKSNPHTPRKSKYSLEVASSRSPKKSRNERLLDRFMDTDIINNVIEHMNLVKQGVIAPNNFNLEEIYSKNTFEYSYNQTNIKDSVKYELSGVNLSNDLNAIILIGSILTVLSNSLNCGYFEEGELDFIYSILTLSTKEQMLLARMVKRKRGWHRKSDIKYPDISQDLKHIFDVLESRFICTFDIRNDDFRVILKLLHTDELRQVAKNMKIDSKGKKEIIIDKLLKLSKSKPLFHGMKSPSSSLYDCIFYILSYCVRITDKTWNIVDMIMTLLLPNEDPALSTADVYYRLHDIYLGKIIYPETPKNHFPIFSCRVHLLSYLNVKSILSTTLKLIENKNWMDVQDKGNFAMETLPSVLKDEDLRLKNSIIPMHVRRFMPGYVWLKILSESLDAFKKCKNIIRAVEILHFLLEQNCHMRTRKGKWYCELALIKMFHQKDVESAALIIMKALDTEHLSQIDCQDLVERAKRIQKKKKGVKPETRTSISNVIHNHNYRTSTFCPAKNIILASSNPRIRNVPGSKSIWCIDNNNTDKSYGSVEALALYYYTEQHFSNGLHCEGNLPILLFTTLFWEELYQEHIPGSFLSPYEDAPVDLYTEYFYENRKDNIDRKLNTILDIHNAQSLSCEMEDRFKRYCVYQSLMPKNLLQHSGHMKEIVHCLGVQGVIGICRRLIDNFKLWKSGFPDLIVWNYDTKQHKIVEVKGPNDVLSTKQLLWLEYLHKLGLNTEVCLVQDKHSSRKSVQTVERFEDCD